MRSLTKCNRFVSSKIHWLNVSSQRRVLQGKRPSENRHTGTTSPDYFKSIIIGINRFSLNSKYAHGFPFIKMVFRGPSWKYEHFLVASAKSFSRFCLLSLVYLKQTLCSSFTLFILIE